MDAGLIVNQMTRRPERTRPLSIPERVDLGDLILRRHEADDAQALFDAYASDVEVLRWLRIKALSDLSHFRQYLERTRQDWEEQTNFAFTMLQKQEAESLPFGAISFKVDVHAAQFGYVMSKRFWGQGLMARALKALVDIVLDQPDMWRVEADCAVANTASARVMQKAGLTYEGTLRRHSIFPNVSLEPLDVEVYAKVRNR